MPDTRVSFIPMYRLRERFVDQYAYSRCPNVGRVTSVKRSSYDGRRMIHVEGYDDRLRITRSVWLSRTIFQEVYEAVS